MNVSDIEIHLFGDGAYQFAIEAKVACILEQNPNADLIELANVLADRLTPQEARYVIVDMLHAALEHARDDALEPCDRPDAMTAGKRSLLSRILTADH